MSIPLTGFRKKDDGEVVQGLQGSYRATPSSEMTLRDLLEKFNSKFEEIPEIVEKISKHDGDFSSSVVEKYKNLLKGRQSLYADKGRAQDWAKGGRENNFPITDNLFSQTGLQCDAKGKHGKCQGVASGRTEEETAHKAGTSRKKKPERRVTGLQAPLRVKLRLLRQL